jgi:hypothetical protein
MLNLIEMCAALSVIGYISALTYHLVSASAAPGAVQVDAETPALLFEDIGKDDAQNIVFAKFGGPMIDASGQFRCAHLDQKGNCGATGHRPSFCAERRLGADGACIFRKAAETLFVAG